MTTGISGKTNVDWSAFALALGDVEVLDTPSQVKRRSRDYFWYSPILERQLKQSFGDLVARPANREQLRCCLEVCAEWKVPLVVRGGGTGNYGQSVPLFGGLIVETTALSRIKSIGEQSVRVEAGCRIADINEKLRGHGRELPIFPSTEKIATIGGFIAGGSGGIGSIRHGMLRDRGNIIDLTALSVEKPCREMRFEGEDVNIIHHAWGMNGVISEIGLRTVPARNWYNIIASFASYDRAFKAAIDLGSNRKLDLKLLSTIESGIVPYLDFMKGRWTDGRHMLLIMVPEEQHEPIQESLRAHGGEIILAGSDELFAAEQVPPVTELAFNHTTLHALKTDRSVTYLQCSVRAPLNGDRIRQLREVLGDDVLLHHEFAQLDGQLVAFDLPIVRYSTDERLHEIMDIYRSHGFGVSNPHSFTVETGGLKTDYRHLAWKRRLDPHGLLNMGKSRAWDEVGQLSPEDIEELQREVS